MGRKILLDKINVPGIRTYDVYSKEGGYASVEKALKKFNVSKEFIAAVIEKGKI